MKELDNFTVERLQEIETRARVSIALLKGDEVAALARIAITAKTAEPVYWEIAGSLFTTKEDALKPGYRGTPEPLYEEPVLNSPELPDGWINCSDELPPYETNVVMWDSRDKAPVIFNTYSEDSYTRGLKLYLAAMGMTHWKPVSPPTTEK